MRLLSEPVKGTHDYDKQQLYRRDYILATLREVYGLYGFEPLETPAMERRATLLEKYGEEGEQLIFHIIKSGDFLSNLNIHESDFQKVQGLISDKGLRYDLTIPLVRYMANNRHTLSLPFRRYQMQPVWRADRPQKGRYREFWQCDIDIVGSRSLLCEAEILKLIYDIFAKLNIMHVVIQVNHRGILNAIADTELKNEAEKAFCSIIDKTEKIGIENVISMLYAAGFSEQVIKTFSQLSQFTGTPCQILEQLQNCIGHVANGAQAIIDLRQVIEKAAYLGVPQEVYTLTPTLARGLSYYTGIVIETRVQGVDIGSLGGGGRYDCLSNLFGLQDLSGVGFSFGLDRLYAVMEAQQRFPDDSFYTIEVLLTNIESQIEPHLLKRLNQLRTNGIKAMIYPQQTKLQKQLSYADKKHIPYVILVGETEYKLGIYLLKNMQTGKQDPYNWQALLQVLKNNLT